MDSLIISKRQPRWLLLPILLGCLPLLWSALQHFDGLQWFGFLLLPFIIRPDKTQTGGNFYLWIGLLFSALYLILGQYYWTFAAALSLIYHLLHTRVGRLNAIAPYSILFYLPLTRSFFTLFGFYVRMEITKWAGWLLSLVNNSVTSQQSNIWVDGVAFSIDPGCMGLRLLITGFLFSLLLVQQLAKRADVKPKRALVSAVLALSFVMVVMANFVRIIFLIQFKSPAGSLSHELIGLASFCLIHVLPMFLVIKWLVSKSGGANQSHKTFAQPKTLDLQLVLMVICVMFFKLNFAEKNVRYSGNEGLRKTVVGFDLIEANDGVHRYANSSSVILVKPMFPLSFSNHHPMLCWRGDGFDVVGEVKTQLGNLDCYSATLSRPGTQLATTWWFSTKDGEQTINEWEWRWKALTQGKQYFLMNIASINRDELIFTSNQSDAGQFVFAKPPL